MAITIPNVFVAGTRIESAPVNANFAAMSNALDKTGDTLTGNLAVGTGITIDGLDISTVPQSGGVFNPNAITFTNIIIGAATTSGIRLDLESGTLAVREGDDSAYGPMLAGVYNVPTGGSLNFNEGSAALAWDTTDSTATLALNANVSHRIGAQELVRVINRTGSAIAKGKAVYIVGSNGTRVDVALADASGEATAATTLGITAESIADGAEGFVCVTGLLRAVTTTGLTEGQIVWLSETAGDLTSTRPTQPAHGVFMGLCVKSAGAGGGILYVSVINGLELDELHDVLITTPAANQILKRNSGNTLWVNASGAALTKTDDTNVTLTLGGSASTALVNAASLTLGWTGQLALSRGGTGASTAQGAINALAGATTSGQYLRGNGSNVVMSAIQASDVPTLNQNTTGTAAGLSSTLAVSSGGTGQTSYTDGQLLIGNTATTSLSKATLTAGSGVSITNGNGTITIAATGGTGTVTSVSGTGTVNGLTLSGTVTTTGDLTLSGTVDSMSALAGSASAPSIAASGDTNTGIYFPAADEVAMTTGGTERLRVDSSGNVGVGVTGTLGQGIEVARDGTVLIRQTRFSTDANGGSTILRKARGTQASPAAVASLDTIGNVSFLAFGGTTYTTVATMSGVAVTYTSDSDISGDLRFSTANSSSLVERFRITSTGNIAIASGSRIMIDGVGGGGDTYITETSANVMTFTTGGTERVRINASGRMLVNMTTENMGLSLNVLRGVGIINYSDSISPELYLRRSLGTEASPTALNSSTTVANIIFQGYGGTNYRSLATISPFCTTYTSDTDMTVAMRFYTTNASSANVERFRIAGNGDIAVGAAAKVLLDGVGATGDTYLTETSANNIAIFTGGSERLRLDGSGNVGVNVTSFGTSAAGVLAVKNGTEPTSGPADTVQIYSVDRSAGNTIPAIYCEGSGVTNAGITSTTVTNKIAIKVNGTVYYLLATTNAT